MKKLDTFSRRLYANDPAQLQYSLACEDLVRRNMGSVNRYGFTMRPTHDDILPALTQVLEKVGKLCTNVVRAPGRAYFLADGWALEFVIESQVDGTEEEEGPRGSVAIRLVSVEVCTIDTELVDKVKELCATDDFVVLEEFEAGKGVPVTFAFPAEKGQVDYVTQSFSGLRLDDVARNYSEDVVESVRVFLEHAKEVTHGLFLLSGPVGTGKSYLIRSILTELLRRRAVVCTPPTQFLDQSSLLSQVVANFRRSIIVLEDVGEVVAIDAATHYVDARTNLLNFTEGFLSMLTDTVIVVSFNYDVDKLDPAILRPGRCLGHVVVNELDWGHAEGLLEFDSCDVPHTKYSLAEVYEMNRVGRRLSTSKGVAVGLRK